MNRQQRRHEAAQQRKKQDPAVYKRACLLLQREHGMDLDQASAVLRDMDPLSTNPFTEDETSAVMIVTSAWKGGLLSDELALELLHQPPVN